MDCGDAARTAAALIVESAVRAAAHTRERTTGIKTSGRNGTGGAMGRGNSRTRPEKASISGGFAESSS
jgi:hypothetical protein